MDYYSQNLGGLWSGKGVQAYATGVHFHQKALPFDLRNINSTTDSVLEIGSSFGQCYRFLMSEGIDLGPRYTGLDVSIEGGNYCRDLYPQANWITGDFRTTGLGRTFDYVIEKNSIHHMPSPLECIAKAIGLAEKAIMMHMRVRTFHPTLSDINQGYFIVKPGDAEVEGRYFYNLLNLGELVDTIRAQDGVQTITIKLNFHDNRSTVSGSGVVVPDDVLDPSEQLYYCNLLIAKGPVSKPQVVVKPLRLRPLVMEGLKRPASILRFFRVRKKLMGKNRLR